MNLRHDLSDPMELTGDVTAAAAAVGATEQQEQLIPITKVNQLTVL